MASQTPPYKELVSEPVHVELPRPILGLFHQARGEVKISGAGRRLGVIEHPPAIGLRPVQLRVAGRRMRLDRPDDATLGERLAALATTFFGFPQRRRVWRAGAGIATEIRETTESRDRLTGSFQIEDEDYQVVCVPYTRAARAYNRQLFSPRGLLAEMERSEFKLHEFFLTPHKPLRLDVLAVAVHLMFWLSTPGGAGGGGPGGAGGGGGGGDGGGGC
ncbi:hypothetical protein H0Z60_19700 [Ectothiorhodospiraceae bacterium WFHF3C12]|nr:hypothetical protein [Ectothiorhodospiraceae bacterium WFHF3C12]